MDDPRGPGVLERAEPPGRLLVTGANGFLGRAIVRQAIESGWVVRGTDLASRPAVHELGDYVAGDICRLDDIVSAMSGVSAVIHAAGLAHVAGWGPAARESFTRINVLGTENVARASVGAGVRHLVLASSVSVYGPQAGNDSPESAPCRPESAYARSKYEAEGRAHAAVAGTAVGLTILRLVTVYGPQDPGNMARLITSVVSRRFVWIGRGRNRKSLLERDDAALACLVAARQPRTGVAVYNVSAPACAMREIVAAIGRAAPYRVPRWYVPGWVARAAVEALVLICGGRSRSLSLRASLSKWLHDDAYDGSRFEDDTGFAARVTLESGLEREIAWLQGERKDRNHRNDE